MKKKNLKGLSLNKKLISNLNKKQIVGGDFTTGCTDGCTPFATNWNCTNGNCSDDCIQDSDESLFPPQETGTRCTLDCSDVC